MDPTNAALLPNNQQLRGELKQKNMLGADGKDRRVLQDIGNLVNHGHARANKKPIVQAGVTKQVQEKTKLEKKVTTLSCDDGGKVKSAARKKSVEGSSKKSVKTFTSVLTARSRAACELSKKIEDLVLDIDSTDVENELAVVEYVDDIYKYYKLTEADGQVTDYMHPQPEINARMRAILVDWLVEVHRRFELMPETLYLTIYILDRFLSVKTVCRRELQLVGISSMLIACKYEEIWAPEVNDFIMISDNAYIREQVLRTEKEILERLGWYLTVPTPYVFLVRYTKASVPSDSEMENMAFFLAELGLMQYQIVVKHCPSKIAASAVYVARHSLNSCPFWTGALEHHTGYTEDMLMDCAKSLVECHCQAAESKLKGVYKKFASADYSAVALLTPAKSILAKSSS